MLSYCKKCGRILYDIFELKTTCDICESPAYEVPKEYIDNFRWRDGDGKQALINELVKTSPEFDQYLFDHKDEILAKQSADFNAKMEHGRRVIKEQSYQPECPTCHSKNVKAISNAERGASILGLGIFSKKINKSFQCKHCGYTW